MTEIQIEARHATRMLPGEVPVTLVKDVSLRFRHGDFVAITGPSGSGKSSLLYLLGLLDRPTSGAILLEGRDTSTMSGDELAALRLQHLGFVFQFHFLLPEFTALENVALPMRRLGALPAEAVRERAASLLGNFGLGAMLDKRPDQLSGGERQRVAVARALANDPLVLLTDEPTGNLDSANARVVFDIFSRLAGDDGKTVIMVTHETDMAAQARHRVEMLDGRVVSTTLA